jgi:RNA polymerase sigma-70 factor (ECF subfamily)
MLKEPSDKQGTVSALETTGSSLSSSLLTRLQCRDDDAFGRLVELYGPVVYGWCRRRGLQPADAADLGQEVFAAVAQRIADFRRDRPGDSFRAWLWGIARHKLLDHLRDRERRPIAVGGSEAQAQFAQMAADEDVSVPEGTAGGDTRTLLHRELELVRLEFEDRTWQAFWRVTVEGQAVADVAGDLGMSRNAVYIARSRILQRLHQEFGDLID